MRISEPHLFRFLVHKVRELVLGSGHMFSKSDRRVIGAVHQHRLKKAARRNLFPNFQPRTDAITAARAANFRPLDIDLLFADGNRLIKILDLFHGQNGRHHFRERRDLSLVRFVAASQYFSGIGVHHHKGVSGRNCQIRHLVIAHRLKFRTVDCLGFYRFDLFLFRDRNRALV